MSEDAAVSEEAAAAYSSAVSFAHATADEELRSELHAECAAAHVNVAEEAQADEHRRELVVASLRAARELQPADPELRHALATSLHATGVAHGVDGQLEAAVAATREALALEPQPPLGPSSYVNLGLLLLFYASPWGVGRTPLLVLDAYAKHAQAQTWRTKTTPRENPRLEALRFPERREIYEVSRSFCFRIGNSTPVRAVCCEVESFVPVHFGKPGK